MIFLCSASLIQLRCRYVGQIYSNQMWLCVVACLEGNMVAYLEGQVVVYLEGNVVVYMDGHTFA